MKETEEGLKPKTAIRPTKKQKELLDFVEGFITANGYSPSYREIMKGAGYTSVATVSLHVNNLIKRGHLVKREHSARSLEVVKPHGTMIETGVVPKQLKASEEKWLVRKVEMFFKEAESSPSPSEQELDKLYVLVGALKVLGLEGAANGFITRLSVLKKRQRDNHYSV